MPTIQEKHITHITLRYVLILLLFSVFVIDRLFTSSVFLLNVFCFVAILMIIIFKSSFNHVVCLFYRLLISSADYICWQTRSLLTSLSILYFFLTLLIEFILNSFIHVFAIEKVSFRAELLVQLLFSGILFKVTQPFITSSCYYQVSPHYSVIYTDL